MNYEMTQQKLAEKVKVARLILYFISGIWLLFVLLSNGMSLGAFIQSIPFLLFLLFTLLSKKYPLVSGVIFLVLAVDSLYFFS